MQEDRTNFSKLYKNQEDGKGLLLAWEWELRREQSAEPVLSHRRDSAESPQRFPRQNTLASHLGEHAKVLAAGVSISGDRLVCLFLYSFDFIFCFSEINPYYFCNKQSNIGNFIGRERLLVLMKPIGRRINPCLECGWWNHLEWNFLTWRKYQTFQVRWYQ